jgi:peptide/nickel transport system substrate-binding protein
MSLFGHLMFVLLVVVLVGCAPTQPPATGPASQRDPEDTGPKTLTIAQPNAREGFAPWFVRGSGRALQYEELHSNFLTSTDATGNLEGRLAERLPSLDDSSIVVEPSGRMRTTWKIRPGVKWQDGASFTADDVVFGWQVAIHPEIPVQQSPALRQIESIEAPDASTALITYKTTFYQALLLGFRDLYPLPKHLLADAFAGNKEAFTHLPFWSSDYIHTGPFRVSEFVPGERVTFIRFDDYFRGRPKLSSVIIRVIGDDNTVLSNVLAGAVDVAGELGTDLAARVRDEWHPTGAGFVVSQQGNWRFISTQFHPEYGGPPELQRDARLRRGLLLGIDRDAIRSVVVPGFADTSADTFMVKGDSRTAVVGTPFGRYRYDTSAALRDFADGGWTRGSDGRLMNRAGQQVQLNIRTTGDYDTELAAVANDWRGLGIDVTEEIMTRALSRDPEYISTFPNLEITAQSNSDSVFRRFNSREQPLAQNRWVGSNGGHYVNPEMDRMIDRLTSTIDETQQSALLKDMGELIAADLPALPMYFSINSLVALKHVKAFEDYDGAARVGTVARNAHLWDRA